MAANAYRSEQRIYFRGDGGTPSISYGYYASYTSGSDEVHPFDSLEAQADFERAIAEAAGEGCESYPLLMAALCAVYLYGDEGDSECAWRVIEDREGEETRNRVIEAAEAGRDKANGIEVEIVREGT